MRVTTVALALSLGLVAAPVEAQDFDVGEIFGGISRALNPEEEQERTQRRQRFEEYDRKMDERIARYGYN